MKHLSKQQTVQEDQYIFPYHYISLYLERYRRLLHLHYLLKLSHLHSIITSLDINTILDVGCGDGRLCYELRNTHIKYTGLDFSERAIDFAKSFNKHAEFHTNTIENYIGFRQFDCITLIDVIEHVPPVDVKHLIDSVQQVLKPGGWLIITVPSINLPLSAKHYQHFTASDLSNLIPLGLHVVEKYGLEKAGKTYNRQRTMMKFLDFLWPLKNKCALIEKGIRHFESWCSDTHLCQAEEGTTLLFKCQKNKEDITG